MAWEEDLSITPPKGWYYDQPETGFRFVANTLGLLEEKVAEHRKGNPGLALGNPREDILAFTKERLTSEP